MLSKNLLNTTLFCEAGKRLAAKLGGRYGR